MSKTEYDIDRVCEEFIDYFKPFIMIKLKKEITDAELSLIEAKLKLFLQSLPQIEYVEVYTK